MWQRVIFPQYAATTLWHDRPTQIRVLESEVHPLVGVGLPLGQHPVLSIDFAHDEAVTITEL
jgi:hypothetical protein